MKKRCFLALLLALSVLFTLSAAATAEKTDVADRSSVLSESAEEYILGINDALNTLCGGKMAVITVDAAEGEDYAQSLFDTWDFGDALRENSVLILLVKSPAECILLPGKSASRFITSSAAKTVADAAGEHFAKGDYDEAAKCALEETAKLYELFYGEKLSEISRKNQGLGTGAKIILIALAVLIVLIIAGVFWATKMEFIAKGGKKWRWVRIPGSRIFFRMDNTVLSDPKFWASRKNRSKDEQ